jgi:serine/threonine protein kinase
MLLTFVDNWGDGMAAGGQVAAGQLIAGRYRIVRPLAVGGLGQVWLGFDEARASTVALKKCALPGGLDAREQALLRSWTLREARAFARVSHPNVIRTLDVLPDDDEPWLVMEYVPSRTLLEVIEQTGPMPAPRVAGIGLAVLAGLTAAGRAGVLHLDVKPGNVLIADDGRVVLTDFGPAVTDEGVGALAGAGIILGSPNYVAPERLFGGVSTARADLWSLGATLYHAVEGRPPYVRSSTAATLRALADSPPDRPRRAGPLTEVLEGLLQREPSARLTAAEVEERLRGLADPPERPGSPVRADLPPAPVPEAGPGPRRRRAVLAGLLALVAALAAVAVVSQRGDRSGLPPVQARPAVSQPVVSPSSPPVLPSGFHWWNDPSGFRVGVPDGWRRSVEGSGTLVFTAPRGQPTLRISRWTLDPPSAVAALIAAERDVRLAGYHRIRIEALPDSPEAVWEYTYQDRAAGPVRDLQRVLVGGGRTYLVEWRAPRAAWAAGLPSLTVVLASFRPPPGA